VSPVEITDGDGRRGWGRGRGWARIQIIQPRESLDFYEMIRYSLLLSLSEHIEDGNEIHSFEFYSNE
jgi:hypothetical protein